jgi:hypothetical protein
VALPEGFEPKNKNEWLELAKSTDAGQRKIISTLLRKLGYQPPDFISWSQEQRVSKIMEHQDEAPPSNGASKGKAAKKSKKPNPAAAAATKAGATASADLGPVNAKLEELEGGQEAILEEVAELKTLSKEIHLMMRVFFETNPDAKANLEDETLQEYYYGKLIGIEGEEEEEDSEED